MRGKSSYVRIETVYKDRENLTLEYLSGQYNEQILENKVHILFENCLDASIVNGKRILIKPNWVRHCISVNDKWCLCTNESLILTALAILLEMNPASIIIADAPIQGCNWDKLLSGYFFDKCKYYSGIYLNTYCLHIDVAFLLTVHSQYYICYSTLLYVSLSVQYLHSMIVVLQYSYLL